MPRRASDRRMRHDCHSVGGRALVLYQSGRDFYGLNLMSVVIEAENISKRFFLGERNQRAFFEDVTVKSVRAFHRLTSPQRSRKREDFDQRFLGASGRFVPDYSRSDLRHYWRKWSRQIDSSKDPVKDHPAYDRYRESVRAPGESPGSWDRFSSRIFRSG